MKCVIKPKMSVLGPRLGKDAKAVAQAVVQAAEADGWAMAKALGAGKPFVCEVGGKKYEVAKDDVELEMQALVDYGAVPALTAGLFP